MKNPQSKIFLLFSALAGAAMACLLLVIVDHLFSTKNLMHLWGVYYWSQLFVFLTVCYLVYPIGSLLILNGYLQITGRKNWKSWITISEEYAYSFQMIGLYPMFVFLIEVFLALSLLGIDTRQLWVEVILGSTGVVVGYCGYMVFLRTFFMNRKLEW